MSRDLTLDCTGQYAGRFPTTSPSGTVLFGIFLAGVVPLKISFQHAQIKRGSQSSWVFIRFEWHAICMFETVFQTWMEREMAEKLGSEYIVDIIEATVRVLVGTGLSREQALQVMLSQLAVQVSPEVMKMAVCVSEKYADAFNEGDWDPNSSSHKSTKFGTTKHPLAYL